MNKKVYELEVGVLLESNNEEFDFYSIKNATEETKYGYFDENRIEFFDYEKAKKYADNYVKNGVNKTYAFIFEETYNLEEEDIKSINNWGYFDHEIDVPSISKWLYYTYKDKEGKIIVEKE